MRESAKTADICGIFRQGSTYPESFDLTRYVKNGRVLLSTRRCTPSKELDKGPELGAPVASITELPVYGVLACKLPAKAIFCGCKKRSLPIFAATLTSLLFTVMVKVTHMPLLERCEKRKPVVRRGREV